MACNLGFLYACTTVHVLTCPLLMQVGSAALRSMALAPACYVHALRCACLYVPRASSVCLLMSTSMFHCARYSHMHVRTRSACIHLTAVSGETALRMHLASADGQEPMYYSYICACFAPTVTAATGGLAPRSCRWHAALAGQSTLCTYSMPLVICGMLPSLCVCSVPLPRVGLRTVGLTLIWLHTYSISICAVSGSLLYKLPGSRWSGSSR